MNMTTAESGFNQNATAVDDQGHGLHDYAGAGEAEEAFQNSGIRHSAFDNLDQADMTEWMWHNDASLEDAAIYYGRKLPGESGPWLTREGEG